MSDGTGVRAADRAAGLLRSAVLLAGLAAILFVSYGIVAPMPPARSWCRLPIGIAARGQSGDPAPLASRRSATKSRTFDEVTRMLGVALGEVPWASALAMLVAYGLVLNFTEERFRCADGNSVG